MRWLEIDLKSLFRILSQPIVVCEKAAATAQIGPRRRPLWASFFFFSFSLRPRDCARAGLSHAYSTQPACGPKGRGRGKDWCTPCALLCRARALRQWKLKVSSASSTARVESRSCKMPARAHEPGLVTASEKDPRDRDSVERSLRLMTRNGRRVSPAGRLFAIIAERMACIMSIIMTG